MAKGELEGWIRKDATVGWSGLCHGDPPHNGLQLSRTAGSVGAFCAAIVARMSFIPQRPMYNALSQLDYLAIAVTTFAGFLFGWLWYSPVLFSKAWMAEMKITEAMMKAAAEKGMAGFFVRGLVYTFLSTFALTILIESRGPINVVKGAAIGAFVGLLLVGARMLNSGVWEQRSVRLLAITVGHEVILFTLQGTILGAWL